MMPHSLELNVLEKTAAYATKLLVEVLPRTFLFHNLNHTHAVVAAAAEIGRQSGLTAPDLELVQIAAWLHGIGYCYAPDHPEEESIRLAALFLTEQNLPADQIKQITAGIAATKIPPKPANLFEQVLCDATFYYLAAKGFAAKSEQLRLENALLTGKDRLPGEWLSQQVTLLKSHEFFTPYARQSFAPQLEKNLKKTKNKKKELMGEPVVKVEKINDSEADKTDYSQKPIIEEARKSARGIETMFRTTSHNHLELSAIADNKANIMITINSINLSLIVSLLFRRFDEFPHLVLPTALLTIICLLTIVFAVLATRPVITTGTFSREDILHKRTNLLFFGNFHQMQLKDYEWGVNEIMKDSNLLYTSMIQDIYFMGKVLGRKYRLLRICYNVFMFGFVVSILSYIIALLFFKPQ